MTDDAPSANGRPAEPPPPFGSWGALYAAVLFLLAALIGAMYLFQEAFS